MWYAAQVRTGSEETVARMCRSGISSKAMSDCIVPEYEELRKVDGEWRHVRRTLFPGYVLLESSDSAALSALIMGLPVRIKLLGSNKGPLIPLTDAECDLLFALMDGENVVRMSEGFIEGDAVKVTKGPLSGHEGRIVKIDRHKRRARLDVSMFGRAVPVTVGLEIVRKTK